MFPSVRTVASGLLLAVAAWLMAGCPAYTGPAQGGARPYPPTGDGTSPPDRSHGGGIGDQDAAWDPDAEGDLGPDAVRPADDVELIADPASRPDWAGLKSGLSVYHGVPALIGVGQAKAAGERSMARLVARRKARAEAHGIATLVARRIGRSARVRGDALLLLETQLQGFVDVLLPDHKRFVPVWEDAASGEVHAAVLIPLDRFLGAVRDGWNVPDRVRSLLAKKYEPVRKDLLRRL